MKYVIDYQIRTTGLDYGQNLSSQDALLKVFEQWKPEDGLTIHSFVSTLDNGGYILLETDDPLAVSRFVGKFVYWNDVKVVPVVDVAEAVGVGAESLAWTRAAINA
jgi:hypothetical protein